MMLDMAMEQKVTLRATICNRKGLHARAAARLVKTAAPFDASVQILRLPRPQESTVPLQAGASSVLGLLMLAAEIGVEIEIQATGPHAKEAAEAIQALVQRRFDEEA